MILSIIYKIQFIIISNYVFHLKFINFLSSSYQPWLWPHYPYGRVIIPRICLRWAANHLAAKSFGTAGLAGGLSLVSLAICRWSRWRHKSSGQSIANVYAPIGGVLNTVRLSISYCLPIHILFSRIIKLIDIRIKSIITFFEIIYHHNNCSTNNFNHK